MCEDSLSGSKSAEHSQFQPITVGGSTLAQHLQLHQNWTCGPNPQYTKLFFIDGPGGTGKSYVLETILGAVRSQGKIAIAVATSGIATLLLTGGRTAHSRFGLPMKLDQDSTLYAEEQTATGRLLEAASVIIWDEAPMAHRFAFEAVDRTLRAFMKSGVPFGGKVVILSGDFRQILPVVPHGVPGQIINACIKRSDLWRHFKSLRLKINMRLAAAPNPSAASEMEAFSNFLLAIGEGRHARCSDPDVDPSNACLPLNMVLEEPPQGTSGASQIVSCIYADVDERYQDASYFGDRAILAPWNVDVDEINERVLDKIPLSCTNDEKIYLSIDDVVEKDTGEDYPQEFLNSLAFSGLPPHKLRLRVGATVILLRNLSGDQGLCNGTRLQICRLTENCIEGLILNGNNQGNRVILPRIKMTTEDTKLPFQLSRAQFPVKLAFAMTIHKAQGQSLHHVGIFLPRPVFSHGQLYVALSRATSRANVKVMIENPVHEDDSGTFTKNIVYPEVIS